MIIRGPRTIKSGSQYFWTSEEQQYLKDNWGQPPEELAEYLGRTVDAVQSRASKTGISCRPAREPKVSGKRGAPVQWTPERIYQTLRDYKKEHGAYPEVHVGLSWWPVEASLVLPHYQTILRKVGGLRKACAAADAMVE